MAMPDEELRQNLLNDAANAESQQSSFEQSAGAAMATAAPRLRETIIRQNKKTIAQSELEKVSAATDETIKHLVEESGLALDTERAQLENALRQRLNIVQQSLISKAAIAAKRVAQMELSQKQKQAIANSIQNLVHTGASMATSGLGGKTTENDQIVNKTQTQPLGPQGTTAQVGGNMSTGYGGYTGTVGGSTGTQGGSTLNNLFPGGVST